jgi:hypothetical protein
MVDGGLGTGSAVVGYMPERVHHHRKPPLSPPPSSQAAPPPPPSSQAAPPPPPSSQAAAFAPTVIASRLFGGVAIQRPAPPDTPSYRLYNRA